MLPLPVRRYISRILIKNETPAVTNLIYRMQNHLQSWRQEVLDLRFLNNPVRVNKNFIDELGALVAAPIRPGDTERTKRQKVAYAVRNHKKFGSWKDQIKLRIDAITGYDSELIESIDSGDWLLLGYESDDPDKYWATMGMDGIDDGLGIDLIGDFDELQIPGNIYINLQKGITTPVISPEILDKLISDLSDPDTGFAVAYYKFFFGYIDAVGSFIIYAIY